MKKTVGFDQKLTLSYLDRTAQLASEKTKLTDVYRILDISLRDDIPGEKARKNAITMLVKIWFKVPDQHLQLRERALALYQTEKQNDRLALHWGMVLLAYPFFRDCTACLGHLFRIQGQATSGQLRQNIKGIYGDRRRVEVAVQAVGTTLRNMGCVTENEKTIFNPIKTNFISDDTLSSWLAAVSLYASDRDALPVNTLATQPYLYPFSFEVGNGLHDYRCLYITTQGVSDLVAVKRQLR